MNKMACVTCDHTMQRVSEYVYLWWCPTCGTIKEPIGFTKPNLVERVNEFVNFFGDEDDTILPMLRQYGITESIGKRMES